MCMHIYIRARDPIDSGSIEARVFRDVTAEISAHAARIKRNTRALPDLHAAFRIRCAERASRRISHSFDKSRVIIYGARARTESLCVCAENIDGGDSSEVY